MKQREYYTPYPPIESAYMFLVLFVGRKAVELGMKDLSDLVPGEWGVVFSVDKSSCLFRRFSDLGIIPGTKIKCITKSPLGDPVAYFVRGTLFSLRKEDAEKIALK